MAEQNRIHRERQRRRRRQPEGQGILQATGDTRKQVEERLARLDATVDDILASPAKESVVAGEQDRHQVISDEQMWQDFKQQEGE